MSIDLKGVTTTFAESTLDSAEDYGFEVAAEKRYSLSVNVREKFGTLLSKTGDVLGKVRDATSKISKLEPITRAFDSVASRIRSKKEKNSEKIEAEKEAGAWSTLGKIYHSSVGKVKAGATAVTGVANYMPSISFFKETEQTAKPNTSRWKPLELLNNLRMPQINLPEFTGSSIDLENASLPRIPDLELPELPSVGRLLEKMSLPDSFSVDAISLPSFSVPKLPTLPSLPSKITEPVIDKIVEKVVDKGITSLEEYVSDPIKESEKQFKSTMKSHCGEKAIECIEAAKVIVNYHTAGCQEKMSGCWERTKSRLSHLHRDIIGYCYPRPLTNNSAVLPS